MTRRIEERKLKTEIARLRDLDLPKLRAVWQEHYGTRAPKTLRRRILILSIAWRIQADAAGGLKPTTRKYLRQVAEAARYGAPVRPPDGVFMAATVTLWSLRTIAGGVALGRKNALQLPVSKSVIGLARTGGPQDW